MEFFWHLIFFFCMHHREKKKKACSKIKQGMRDLPQLEIEVSEMVHRETFFSPGSNKKILKTICLWTKGFQCCSMPIPHFSLFSKCPTVPFTLPFGLTLSSSPFSLSSTKQTKTNITSDLHPTFAVNLAFCFFLS